MILLPKGSILKFNGNSLTEHNRSELEISPLEISQKERMADGSLRKQYVATKRTFSVSWDKCPATAVHTVDGKWGGREIKQFYDANKGSFPIVVTYGDGSSETITVMFEEFSCAVQKRTQVEQWSINLSLEEV